MNAVDSSNYMKKIKLKSLFSNVSLKINDLSQFWEHMKLKNHTFSFFTFKYFLSELVIPRQPALFTSVALQPKQNSRFRNCRSNIQNRIPKKFFPFSGHLLCQERETNLKRIHWNGLKFYFIIILSCSIRPSNGKKRCNTVQASLYHYKSSRSLQPRNVL